MWPSVSKWQMAGGRWHLLLATCYLLLLVACQSVMPVVKIGLVGPFEGRQREIGYDVIYSARLAVREINEAGGIGDYRVALVALDDGGDVALAQETAESLMLDPAVVLVIGHWLTATTAVATPIYTQANIPFIAMNHNTFDETQLPADFHTAYESVTPFDEVAGEYAGATYDAFQLVWLAMEKAADEGNGYLTSQAIAESLQAIRYEGMTGEWTFKE